MGHVHVVASLLILHLSKRMWAYNWAAAQVL